MVYCKSTMSSHNESVEVDSLMCWNANASQDYLDGHKLLLSDHDLESLSSDSENQKSSSLDILDNLLTNTSLNSMNNSTNLAELKPLPPFTGYTGHLSINGISGHHYHAIAQRLPEENNNSYSQSSFQNNPQCGENNIVSSSTCLPDSGLSENCLSDVKLFSESNSIGSKLYSASSSTADSCLLIENSMNMSENLNETKIFVDAKELVEYDMSSIEDIAAIIGSAIADTTVPNNRGDANSDNGDTRDSWMDLDAWIEETVVPQDNKAYLCQNDNLSEFLLPNSPLQSTNATLQNLLSQGYMPLLQNRLQNGPPIKLEAQSTSYNDLMPTTSTSPPGSVCSSTDLNSNNKHPYLSSTSNSSRNFSHSISSSATSSTTKMKKSRGSKKSSHSNPSTTVISSNLQVTSLQGHSSISSHGYQSSNDLNGLLGKEKPVHRCTICNRGFLNKSNIKVHLRTHTGEKPFRCETCAKAFRQKAHLIKHQQIHKRIGRD